MEKRMCCESCDDALRPYIGCFDPPLISEAEPYDHEAWLAFERTKAHPGSMDPAPYAPRYRFHNAGRVRDFLGLEHSWPFCPRSYILYAGDVAMIEAESILRRCALHRSGLVPWKGEGPAYEDMIALALISLQHGLDLADLKDKKEGSSNA